ncbi:hypothetical protein C7N43_38850 [Sphingobacteriales bacterium UPWRP_1]|nr:hypothetical protein C7N43_38850 [Sphingobacteriales bacterium UPWRP_1]
MNTVSLYYFTSAYCAPCKQIRPWVNQLPLNYPISLYTINVDDDPQTAAQYNAVFLPTLVWYVNGKEVNRQNGAADITQDFLNNLAAQYTAGAKNTKKCPIPKWAQTAIIVLAVTALFTFLLNRKLMPAVFGKP